MKRSIARFLAVPVVSAGILAGVAVTAPSALASTDTGGTVTVTIPLGYLKQLAEAGVIEFPVPLSQAVIDKTDQTAVVTFQVTGGDGDARVFFGSVDVGGQLVIASAHGKEATLNSLNLNLENADIEGTPSGSSTPVPLLDLAGDISAVGGTTSQTVNASELTVDPAGASYLNGVLNTSAFTAGQNVGSLAATWDFSV